MPTLQLEDRPFAASPSRMDEPEVEGKCLWSCFNTLKDVRWITLSITDFARRVVFVDGRLLQEHV